MKRTKGLFRPGMIALALLFMGIAAGCGNITNKSTFNCKYQYDCIYVVSYNGKGMKVITTGDMTMSSSGSYTYNLHYAVYDNNNVARYNYDYKS
jgi:hypothetical protein